MCSGKWSEGGGDGLQVGPLLYSRLSISSFIYPGSFSKRSTETYPVYFHLPLYWNCPPLIFLVCWLISSNRDNAAAVAMATIHHPPPQNLVRNRRRQINIGRETMKQVELSRKGQSLLMWQKIGEMNTRNISLFFPISRFYPNLL